MNKLTRAVLFAVLVLLGAVSPAHATDASDAYKRAKELAKRVELAESDENRAAAESDLATFAKSKSASLLSGELGKMDTAYVGLIQGLGGMKVEAVATLKKAIDHPGTSKYVSTIYSFYAKALIDNGQGTEALAVVKEMSDKFPGDKRTKGAAFSVGMGLREMREWKASAEALRVALMMKVTAALKPLVNSLLLSNQKDAAVEMIEWAIEAAGENGADPRHQVLLDITKRVGEPLPLEFDAFAPGPPPDLDGKVVVMAFWNVSAGTLRWTMEFLQSVYSKLPPAKGVVTLGVSTYYKKNPDTGVIEDDMSGEVEREFGVAYRNTHGYEGQLAYTPDEADLYALGLSGLPYVVVRGKDGKLLYTHTINRDDPTEIEVLLELIEKAAK